MIFKFLRHYLWDDEFEQNKVELAETKQVLSEYKQFIQDQRKQFEEERKKVEPDFLTLLWGSTGVAAAVFVESAQTLEKFKNDSSNFEYWIWLAVALFSLYFMFRNGIIGIQLTQLYSSQKVDERYKIFSNSMIIGEVLFIIIIVLFYLDKQY